MPWADNQKNLEAVRRWRAAHPGYWRRYERSPLQSVSRYKALDEDLAQQAALARLSRRKEDCVEEYRRRERRWIQMTDFKVLDGQGEAGRRSGLDDDP